MSVVKLSGRATRRATDASQHLPGVIDILAQIRFGIRCRISRNDIETRARYCADQLAPIAPVPTTAMRRTALFKAMIFALL
jgi:hypothetical protein